LLRLRLPLATASTFTESIKDVISEDSAIHHIFPREYLKDQGETRDEYINCIGNLTFIDPGVNSEIGDTPPEDYLKDYTGIFEQHMSPLIRSFGGSMTTSDFLTSGSRPSGRLLARCSMNFGDSVRLNPQGRPKETHFAWNLQHCSQP